MPENYFKGTAESPYHISIGAVVMNAEGKIACHFFETTKHSYFKDYKNFYLLVRETLEPGESIEACLARGLEEEFGMKAKLKKYLGSTVRHFPLRGRDKIVEKTTLYFLCEYISLDESKRKAGDVEADSRIIWVEPGELAAKMKEQGKKYKNESIDESGIIERIRI